MLSCLFGGNDLAAIRRSAAFLEQSIKFSLIHALGQRRRLNCIQPLGYNLYRTLKASAFYLFLNAAFQFGRERHCHVASIRAVFHSPGIFP